MLDFESASMLLDSAQHTRKASDAITQSSRFEDENNEEHDGDEGDIHLSHSSISFINSISSLTLSLSCSLSLCYINALTLLHQFIEGGVNKIGRGGMGRLNKLTLAITSLLDDFTMVSFIPLNLKVSL